MSQTKSVPNHSSLKTGCNEILFLMDFLKCASVELIPQKAEQDFKRMYEMIKKKICKMNKCLPHV